MASKYKIQTFKGTHSCGHYAKINVGGYSEEYREEKSAEMFADKCADCLKADLELERAKASEEAAAEAKKANLPVLTGSEKQIAWAVTLRKQLIDKFHDVIEHAVGDDDKNNMYESLNRLIQAETTAKWFIDMRHGISLASDASFLHEWNPILVKYKEPSKEELTAKQAKEELLQEGTIYPENYNGVMVEVRIKDATLHVDAPYDYELMKLVKSFNYKWSGATWQKTLGIRAGNREDRVAEIGNHLISKGFGVRTMDVPRDKIINADYTPETDRWVLNAPEDRVNIVWGKSSDFYYESKGIKGAKWDRNAGAMKVPATSWRQIRDFADTYSFTISENAEKTLLEQEQREENKVATAPPIEVEADRKLQDILDSPADVLDDLKDS